MISFNLHHHHHHFFATTKSRWRCRVYY